MNESNLDLARIFRELYLADLESSGDRGLAAYQELFPGHEEEIASLHARISLGAGDRSDEPRATIGLDTSPGALVGHYRIDGEIGRGGQAVVFRAQDEKLGRPVALKLLVGAVQRGEAGLRRFRREAEVCSRLDHPGICTVHDTGIQGGIPYIVMEFIAGSSLVDWVRGGTSPSGARSEFLFSDDLPESPDQVRERSPRPAAGPLPDRERIDQVIEVFARIADALHAAHEAGVIHRDIKPGNVLVKRDGQPVILDFGLAQDHDSELHALTQTGDFFGTPAYMSPEQISAHRIRLDFRTDIFSLGVSLYEALTGTRPFDAPSREGIYQAILTKSCADPRGLNREIPRDLAVVVEKALEKDRDRRYASAGEFAADLRRILRFEPIKARPAGLGLKLLRWTQRNRGLAAAIVALPLVVATTMIAQGLVEQRREQDRRDAERRDHAARLGRELDELGQMLERNDMRLLLQPRVLRKVDAHVNVLGEEGLALIRARLDSTKDTDRLGAMSALSHLGDQGALPKLLEIALGDENAMVRIWGSQILMRMEGDGVNAALLRIFRESDSDACQVNALFGLVFNEEPEAARLANDFVHDDQRALFLRIVLAKNLMYLARADMAPVAAWLFENLQPLQAEEWGTLIRHHQLLGGEENVAVLRRIAADERLDERLRQSAQEALDEIGTRASRTATD